MSTSTNNISGLLDTNILIDIIRRYQPAVEWVKENEEQRFAIPSLVRMELVFGTRNGQEQRQIVDFLNRFSFIHLEESDSLWALQQFEARHLSHQIEIIDCFIAAQSFRLNLPIYTRNIRDLGAFEDVSVVKPYS